MRRRGERAFSAGLTGAGASAGASVRKEENSKSWGTVLSSSGHTLPATPTKNQKTSEGSVASANLLTEVHIITITNYMKLVGIHVEEEIWQRVREKAVRERTSISAVVRGYLQEWVGGSQAPAREEGGVSAKPVRKAVSVPAKAGSRKASKSEPPHAGSGGMYQKSVGWGGIQEPVEKE